MGRSFSGSSLMMGKSGSLSTPCSCLSLYSFCRRTSWCRSLSLHKHTQTHQVRHHWTLKTPRVLWEVVWYAPGSCHVDPHLLQETLPVADVQVGASGLDLILDVHIKSLKLTVRLPFKHALHVCADGCVYALTTVTWHDPKNRDDEGLLCTALSLNILNSIIFISPI